MSVQFPILHAGREETAAVWKRAPGTMDKRFPTHVGFGPGVVRRCDGHTVKCAVNGSPLRFDSGTACWCGAERKSKRKRGSWVTVGTIGLFGPSSAIHPGPVPRNKRSPWTDGGRTRDGRSKRERLLTLVIVPRARAGTTGTPGGCQWIGWCS